ncbi:uncharacterized protein LOC125947007 [Dermacentor silvarum]|uniref:uncharacterized protein LOC119435570 n=1 Tax=Dermacentor silvarum TaxID=543639 RepID=UPI00210161F5|nr:uncharacterized protein LOC119435570 [Dermacentor silvarum]XP_049527241.1 uncharacterized protein LOC125947007 [Dermacentor silvarum]
MPKRKRYKAYLYDALVGVPARTRCRRKAAESSSQVVPDEVGSSPGGSESDENTLGHLSEESALASVTLAASPLNLSNSHEDGLRERSLNSGACLDSEDGDVASTEPCDCSYRDSSSTADEESDQGPEESQQEENELDVPLYPEAKISKGQSLIMVMAHSLRHHSSKEATESLLKIIDAHLPEGATFPKTKYLFFKNFSSVLECERTTHVCCPKCSEYLVSLPCATADIVCLQCTTQHRISSLVESGSFFLTLDLDAQIKEILLSGKLPQNRRAPAYDVADITQSTGYATLPLTDDDISFTWNTDGVPLFKSSGQSVWPLLLQVNELPFKERVQKLLLFGLWFGSGKPNMNAFLKPYVDTMNRLSSEGISWTTKSGMAKTCRAYPGPCTVDTVARCLVMNMTQFNGAHGCAWCEHSGEVIAKGKGHTRVYPIEEAAPRLRTQNSFERHVEQAHRRGEPSCGIKGASVLFFMAFLKFPCSFVVDYMHAVCNGFVRTTTFMWFSHKRQTEFSLGSHLGEIDQRLSQQTPIWETTRLPRSLREMKFWKASEWRDWLLFFSPVVLKGFLPRKYYKNWTMFVALMHFCLQPSIPLDRIAEVKKLFVRFLKDYQELYGRECMSYNAHILLHMVDHVSQWGPLWGFSAYPFESMNGRLLRLVNGTRYAHAQIVEKFAILMSLPQVVSKNNKWQSADLRSLVNSLVKGYNLKRKFTQKGAVVLYGKGSQQGSAIMYQKAAVGAFTYCVAAKDKSRRKNSFVVSSAGVFGQVVNIFINRNEQSCSCVFFKIKKLHVVDIFLSCLVDCQSVYFASVEETNDHAIVSALDIKKCMVLYSSGKTVLSAIHEEYVLESN